jgi:predicted kinase
VKVVRRLVYVSGAPGSGKSTLAAPLAAELGYALLGKDIIKETLHSVLGPPDLDRARSRELGAASMELLWALAARSPQVLIEANFRPYSDYERNRLTALGGVQVEVHCACPPELAVARYNARPRHPVHVLTSITPDDLAEFDRPVGIGALVTVDTTGPVDVAAIAARVRSLLLSRKRAREWRGAPGASRFALRASCCYLTLATADEDSGSLGTSGCIQRSIIMPLAQVPPLYQGPGRMGGSDGTGGPGAVVSDGTLVS